MKQVSPKELLNIEREIGFHQKIDHPNIIKFYDYLKKEEERKVLILLEFAENGDLFNYLNKKSPLDERTVCRFFVQTALALNYIHSHKMIHRDVKPENILLDKFTDVKLCDFGWSAEYDEGTRRQTVCGTYEYMAPEILFKKQQDTGIDIWALGILLYELIHNKAPYSGRSLGEVSKKIAAKHIDFGQNTAEDAKDLILKILKINPKERPSIKQILSHPFIIRCYGFVEESKYKLAEKKEAPQNLLRTSESSAQSPVFSPVQYQNHTYSVETKTMRGSGFQPAVSHFSQHTGPTFSFAVHQIPPATPQNTQVDSQYKKPHTTHQLIRANSMNNPQLTSHTIQPTHTTHTIQPTHSINSYTHANHIHHQPPVSAQPQFGIPQPVNQVSATRSSNSTPYTPFITPSPPTQDPHQQAYHHNSSINSSINIQQAANKYGKHANHSNYDQRTGATNVVEDRPALQPLNTNTSSQHNTSESPKNQSNSRLAMNSKMNNLRLRKVISEQPAFRSDTQGDEKNVYVKSFYQESHNQANNTEANVQKSASYFPGGGIGSSSVRHLLKQNSFEISASENQAYQENPTNKPAK